MVNERVGDYKLNAGPAHLGWGQLLSITGDNNARND